MPWGSAWQVSGAVCVEARTDLSFQILNPVKWWERNILGILRCLGSLRQILLLLARRMCRQGCLRQGLCCQLERGEEAATSWVFHPGLWQSCGAAVSSAWLETQAESDGGLRCPSHCLWL